MRIQLRAALPGDREYHSSVYATARTEEFARMVWNPFERLLPMEKNIR
jgi:hypothetical protein